MIGLIARVIAIMIVSAIVCLSAGGTKAQPPSEYQIKAAFLYNFAKFVEWPTKAFRDGSGSMNLCVLGEDPFGDDLEETIQGKIVNGRELMIKRFKALQGVESCHILFISSLERGNLPQILAALKHMSLLTVGEMDRFAKLGGIINFTLQEKRVRFEINVDAAEQAGLKISSQLLKLAKIIRDGDKN